MALQPTVVTRRALSIVGPFDESIPIANDFPPGSRSSASISLRITLSLPRRD